MGAMGAGQGASCMARRVHFAADYITKITPFRAGDAKRKGKVERCFRQADRCGRRAIRCGGPDDLQLRRVGAPRPSRSPTVFLCAETSHRIVVAAAFVGVPQRSSGRRAAPAAARRPAISGERSPLLRWAALLVQACGGQTDPGNAIANAPPPTTEPERPPTPPDTAPTPDSEPRRSTARNATRNDEECNPQRPTVLLAEHPPDRAGQPPPPPELPCSVRPRRSWKDKAAETTADCASCAPAGAATGIFYPVPSRCRHQVLGRVRAGQRRCVRERSRAFVSRL